MKRKWRPNSDLGEPDFFDDRHKRKMLQLAKIKPRHVFYDLGCGDASILIFAVKEFAVRKAIGYESDAKRAKLAMKNVSKEKLQNHIEIRKTDFKKSDLHNADVIVAMHTQHEKDFTKLWSQKIKNGTKLIKHDLPLLGYLPDKIDVPFYRHTFPLKKAKSQKQWASFALGRKNSDISQVWHELVYYEHEKAYSDSDIVRMKNILSRRLK